jgi:hypothetical protein
MSITTQSRRGPEGTLAKERPFSKYSITHRLGASSESATDKTPITSRRRPVSMFAVRHHRRFRRPAKRNVAFAQIPVIRQGLGERVKSTLDRVCQEIA